MTEPAKTMPILLAHLVALESADAEAFVFWFLHRRQALINPSDDERFVQGEAIATRIAREMHHA